MLELNTKLFTVIIAGKENMDGLNVPKIGLSPFV